MQRKTRENLILLCDCLLSLRLQLAAGVIVVGLLLSGCAFFSEPPPLRDEAIVHIKLVDNLPYGHYGKATCAEGLCTVLLRRDTYPYCLGHEVRHAFEGNWHEGRESVDDCR